MPQQTASGKGRTQTIRTKGGTMRNSDDAKLIAGAIEKAGRLISEAIKENTRVTAQNARYQIPERTSNQFIARDSSGAFHEAAPVAGMGHALPTDTREE